MTDSTRPTASQQGQRTELMDFWLLAEQAVAHGLVAVNERGLVEVDALIAHLLPSGSGEEPADRFANARRVRADQVATWIGLYGRLLPQHAALLQASAIELKVTAARGYRSVTTRAEATGLGFSEAQARVPALLLPLHDVIGQVRTHQIRPDEPRIGKGGKPIKYETPAGSTMAVDVPPAVRAKLGDPSVPLVITEGVRKDDAAVSAGLACIAILGVFNWRGKNGYGGKTALPDWEDIALNGRRIFLCFDSDVGVKPEVNTALERLKKFLELRGARVRIIHLPPGENGSKTGLDDYLAAGHTAEELLALASPDLPAAEPRSANATTGGPYLTDAEKPQAQRLVEFIADGTLFRSTDGETAFATIPVGDHHETWPVRSKGLRRWLINRFYQIENKPPAAQALADALGTLEAKAHFGGGVADVHVRLAGAREAV